MKKTIVLVMGLPGSGKTTFSDMLASKLQAARVNADDIRENVSTDLTFSADDRIQHARRMAHIGLLAAQGRNSIAVVDFICPNSSTYSVFSHSILKSDANIFVIWMDTIKTSRYPDTDAIFQEPSFAHYVVKSYCSPLELEYHANIVQRIIDNQLNVRTYLLRYNTLVGTGDLRWRIIDAETRNEKLATSFKTHGSLVVPQNSVEHGVEKWNVCFKARAIWTDLHVDFY